MWTSIEPFHFESTRPINRPQFAQQSEEIKWVPLNGTIKQLDGILYFVQSNHNHTNNCLLRNTLKTYLVAS